VIQDIRAFYKFLDKDEKARDLQRYSYGHSWGGYSALLTALPEFHVSKIVSLSGFISELDEYTSLAPQTNNFLIRFLIKIRGRVNTPGGPLSVIPGMEKTTAKILYVQGKDDEVVPWARSGEVLAKKFANKNNISFMFVPGRNHSIMSTPEASVYFKGLVAQGINEINGPVGLTMDLDKSTEEDKEVTKATFDFFLS
jgi:uncharacterized protein